MHWVWLLPLAYVAGSINFAIILLGWLRKEDPRTKFSGNAGTTNVYRQAGIGWAAVVLLLDVGRAVGLAALAIGLLPDAWVPWVGAALVAGNRFPCFHKFQGGKGVAAFLGFTGWISPWGALLSCFVWVVVYVIVRIPFIASFFMVLVLGGATVWTGEPRAAAVAGTAATVLLIFFSHWKNIAAWRAERRRKA